MLHILTIAVGEIYTCLHSQFKVAKYWCSAKLPFKTGVNLVFIWGLLQTLFTLYSIYIYKGILPVEIKTVISLNFWKFYRS